MIVPFARRKKVIRNVKRRRVVQTHERRLEVFVSTTTEGTASRIASSECVCQERINEHQKSTPECDILTILSRKKVKKRITSSFLERGFFLLFVSVCF